MNVLSSFIYSSMKFVSPSLSLDESGTLKFVLVTPYKMSSSATYQLSLTISPSTSLHLNPAISILRFVDSGTTTAIPYTSTDSSSQLVVKFEFSLLTDKNLIQLDISDVFMFEDIIVASFTL